MAPGQADDRGVRAEAIAARKGVAPERLPQVVPAGPGRRSLQLRHGDVVIQRFRHLPSHMVLPPLRDEVLIAHLAEPFRVEARNDAGATQRRWICPGQVGVTPAGLQVERRFSARPDVVLVHLDPGQLRAVGEEMFGIDGRHVRLVPALGDADDTCDRYIRLLLREAERPQPGGPIVIESLSRALMAHVLRRHSTLALPSCDRLPALAPGRLRRVDEYMRAHLAETLSLVDLAAVAGISASHLTRAFRKAAGIPPHRYLAALRIDRARQLLETTDLPIIEVGYHCGYPQPSHFSTVFRNATGVPPRAWRSVHGRR